MELGELFWELQTQQYENMNEYQKSNLNDEPFDDLILEIPSLSLLTLPQHQDICLQIHELNENGIMNPIGGELWEASLLLCSLILRNDHYFSKSSVLELGSGVGIPSILLLIMKQRYLQNAPNYSCGSIYLTDYDEEVLNNLKNIVTSQFPGIRDITMNPDSSSSSLKAQLKKLDWNDFIDENACCHQKALPCCDVLIGSELVYTNTQLGLSSLIWFVPFFLFFSN
jgi:hypothetical protein